MESLIYVKFHIPIYDAKERLDNFIAFEKEIPVDKPRINNYLS